MKTCTKCGEEKRLAEFGKRKAGVDGYKAQCRSCIKLVHTARIAATRVNIDNKPCSICGTLKPIGDFHRRVASQDGVANKCKVCQQKYNANHYGKNKDQYARKSKKYREENKEKLNEWHNKYYAENKHRFEIYREMNKEKIAHRAKLRRQKFPETHKAHLKSWNLRHPHKNTYYINKRRSAKKQCTPAWADLEAIETVYIKAAQLREFHGVEVHVDHMYPLTGRSTSGLNVWENLQILEADANHAKYNKHPDDIVHLGWLYPQALKSHPLYEGG